MIVIKSLKDSLVLQQAEEDAQKKIKDNYLKGDDNANTDNIESSKYHPEIQSDKDAINLKGDVKENDKTTVAEKEKPKEKTKDSSNEKKRKHKSRSRSRTRHGSKSHTKRSRSKEKKSKYSKKSSFRSRSRSRSRSRTKYRSRSKSWSRKSRSRSRSRHRKSHKSKRERKHSPSPDCVDSLRDKATRKRLLEVARKNAVYLMKNDCLPPNIEQESVRATGKSVEELTRFCKQLVAKDYAGSEGSDPSLSPDEERDTSEKPFGTSRHPFAIKDKPILMNIRNAPMLPLKTNAERLADTSKLREQFPVSSGFQHRHVAESEWVPVEKDDKEKQTTVFPEANSNVDISHLVSTRLNAMRRLQDNPRDSEAMKELSNAQKEMQNWALSKQKPGQFTGSTGARILTQEELNSGYQAWAKKDQFKINNPVTSHFGMKMLQKMGWNPGEGLGKNKEGTLEPLVLDVKMDKKGLSAAQEVTPRRAPIPLARSLQGKHPVSALVEVCIKRKWNPPEFEIVFDCGPDHKKNFLMKVHVNNQTYQTTVAAPTKKIAKANAAAACLQALGLIPKDPPKPGVAQQTAAGAQPQQQAQQKQQQQQPATAMHLGHMVQGQSLTLGQNQGNFQSAGQLQPQQQQQQQQSQTMYPNMQLQQQSQQQPQPQPQSQPQPQAVVAEASSPASQYPPLPPPPFMVPGLTPVLSGSMTPGPSGGIACDGSAQATATAAAAATGSEPSSADQTQSTNGSDQQAGCSMVAANNSGSEAVDSGGASQPQGGGAYPMGIYGTCNTYTSGMDYMQYYSGTYQGQPY